MTEFFNWINFKTNFRKSNWFTIVFQTNNKPILNSEYFILKNKYARYLKFFTCPIMLEDLVALAVKTGFCLSHLIIHVHYF